MQDKFFELGLSAPLLRAIDESGYKEPTPIQQKSIPAILMNRDILGCAQTGTGKTASFTLPLLDILASGRSRARMPRSVILTPTRELAAQIADNFDRYGKYVKLSKSLLIGGVALGTQEQELLKGVDVLIATPGRLLDHLGRGSVMLNDVQILVIDEADRMLDMGFIPDVEKLVGLMPKTRQTLMFSATMAPEVRKLAEKFLTDPREVTVSPPSSTGDSIEQAIIKVSSAAAKRKTLSELLRAIDVQNAIVFCNRKRETATLAAALEKEGFAAGPLHGDMDQYKRLECLDRFKKGEITILVCSDVAARGLDIPSVSHVFNYDLPTQGEDYVHRIGRTGRAGRTGIALSLATKEDSKYIDIIENIIGKKIPVRGAGKMPDIASEGAKSPPKAAPNKPAAKQRTAKAESEKADSPPSKKASPEKTRTEKARPEKAKTAKAKPTKHDSKSQDNFDDTPNSPPQAQSKTPFGETDFVPAFLK